MKCQCCEKESATIHLTEIINNEITEVHLCEKCAKEKGIEANNIKSTLSFNNIKNLFTSLIPDKNAVSTKGTITKLECPFCNMTYTEFSSKGKFGCSKCYEVFKNEITPLIRRIHGSVQHLGKVPVNLGKEAIDKYTEIKDLKLQLMDSIKKEEYEKAAVLRDKIKKISKSEVI